MSGPTEEENAECRGAQPSDDGSQHVPEGMAALLEAISRRALDHDGGLNLDASSLDALRSNEKREKLLRDFVVRMMPMRVNPGIWLSWLNGSARPGDRASIPRPDTGGERLGKYIDRQSKRVQRAVSGVVAARRAVELAQAKLVEAEKQIVKERAFESAAIEYAVSEELMGILRPMFAMGPAWAIMRIVSSNIDPLELEEELKIVRLQKRAEQEARIRKERKDQSERLFTTLDYWSGDAEFEYVMREAIASVADTFSKRTRRDGTLRSPYLQRRGVNPDAKRDEHGVIDGMNVGGVSGDGSTEGRSEGR